MGQNSHQFSCCFFPEDTDRCMICLRGTIAG
jgi:hypothetical protein